MFFNISAISDEGLGLSDGEDGGGGCLLLLISAALLEVCEIDRKH